MAAWIFQQDYEYHMISVLKKNLNLTIFEDQNTMKALEAHNITISELMDRVLDEEDPLELRSESPSCDEVLNLRRLYNSAQNTRARVSPPCR